MPINLNHNRMDDYAYDDAPPPMPTFSEGSHGPRGANSKASASRASASKSAVSAASRASAIMAASIEKLPKGAIVTSNGIISKKPSAPPVNKSIIEAAQRRANEVLKKSTQAITQQQNAAATNSVPTHYPNSNIPIIPNFQQVIPTFPQQPAKMNMYSKAEGFELDKPKPVKVNTIVSEQHKNIVTATLNKKKELLKTADIITIRPVKKYKNVDSKLINIVLPELPDNTELILKLRNNLSMHITNSSDNQAILDEYNNYLRDLRISTEHLTHKEAIKIALANKDVYLTSDA